MNRTPRSLLTIAVVCAVLLAGIAAPVSAAPTHDRGTAPQLTAGADGDLIGDEPRDGRNPQTGKEIKIAAKNVVREAGATGTITVGEDVSITLPDGRRIIREVGQKK